MTSTQLKKESNKAVTAFTAISNLAALGIFSTEEREFYRERAKARFKHILK
jgi:DNA invertase Pin-like site-specific DNA recombinase